MCLLIQATLSSKGFDDLHACNHYIEKIVARHKGVEFQGLVLVLRTDVFSHLDGKLRWF